MLFVFRSKTLHNYCLQFLVEVKMAPREPETMLMQNFGVTNQEHYGMLWYFWSGQFNKCLENLENLEIWR